MEIALASKMNSKMNWGLSKETWNLVIAPALLWHAIQPGLF